MKYLGSKRKIAKKILSIVLKDRKQGGLYIEPFAGGMNVIEHVDGLRLANDLHPYLIDMWEALVYEGWTPEPISKDLYEDIRHNPTNYPRHLVGWAGFNCSYSGKYFAGFAGRVKTKTGIIRDYQDEAIRHVTKQIYNLKGVYFKNLPYNQLTIPKGSTVYCDPPYANTTSYAKVDFDHTEFWGWCRKITRAGNKVYISEYTAPEDFKCVWSQQVSSSLSANGKVGGNKKSVEKLFCLDSKINHD